MNMWPASDSRASDDVATPTTTSSARNASRTPREIHSRRTCRPPALASRRAAVPVSCAHRRTIYASSCIGATASARGDEPTPGCRREPARLGRRARRRVAGPAAPRRTTSASSTWPSSTSGCGGLGRPHPRRARARHRATCPSRPASPDDAGVLQRRRPAGWPCAVLTLVWLGDRRGATWPSGGSSRSPWTSRSTPGGCGWPRPSDGARRALRHRHRPAPR